MTRFQLTPANNPTSHPTHLMIKKYQTPFALLWLSLTSAMFAAPAPSPSAGEQTREIKALSESDIDNLRNGRGMSLARPAELNSYPGPRHVLDTAVLALTPAQTATLTRVFAAMKSAAIPLGEKIIERETALDHFFTGQHATTESVRALTVEIGQLQGELRAVHLNAHVATVAILTPAQIARYNQARGYTSN